jgi:hypothetical protein
MIADFSNLPWNTFYAFPVACVYKISMNICNKLLYKNFPKCKALLITIPDMVLGKGRKGKTLIEVCMGNFN